MKFEMTLGPGCYIWGLVLEVPMNSLNVLA